MRSENTPPNFSAKERKENKKIYFRFRSALPERHDADGERQCETCQPDLAYTCRNVDGNLVCADQ